MNTKALAFSSVYKMNKQAQTAIPASKAALTIGDFKLRVVGIVFDKTALGFVPMDIDASDEVMFVEIELLSGNREFFRSLQLTIASPSGRKMKPIIMASNGMIKTFTAVTMRGVSSGYQPGKNNIAWAYVVPKGMDELSLNFPTGEVLDISPLIKRFN